MHARMGSAYTPALHGNRRGTSDGDPRRAIGRSGDGNGPAESDSADRRQQDSQSGGGPSDPSRRDDPRSVPRNGTPRSLRLPYAPVPDHDTTARIQRP